MTPLTIPRVNKLLAAVVVIILAALAGLVGFVTTAAEDHPRGPAFTSGATFFEHNARVDGRWMNLQVDTSVTVRKSDSGSYDARGMMLVTTLLEAEPMVPASTGTYTSTEFSMDQITQECAILAALEATADRIKGQINSDAGLTTLQKENLTGSVDKERDSFAIIDD